MIGGIFVVSSVSSSLSAPTAAMMHQQQIQALDSQVMRLESQISGLQERIIDVQENEGLSAEEKKENIASLNEQIKKVRDRVSDIQLKISEKRNQQIKAENEAKSRRKSSEERAGHTDPEEEEGARDSAVIHALSGIDLKPGRLNVTKAQTESRLREAKQEDMFRVRDDGRLVVIQRENRRPRNPEEARNAQTRIDGIKASLIRDGERASDAVRGVNENTPTKKPHPSEEGAQGAGRDKQRSSSGTGRMGKGQYLEDEA